MISDFAKRLRPYTAGEQPQDKSYIKLNTNENPFPPSPLIYKALSEFDFDTLRLYPDPDSRILREAVAAAEGVGADNVFCGNGSDEILSFAFAAFFGGEPVCFADVTYSFYPVYCNFYGIPFRAVPLKEDFALDIRDYTDCRSSGIVIANPNAPTSLGIPKAEIERVVASNADRVVLVDEAYMDFYGESAVPLTKKYGNLLVVKTFSKSYSLAGLRVGYAIGAEDLIKTLKNVKDSFNSYPLDKLAQCLAAAAIGDKEYHNKCVDGVVENREYAKTELRKRGFSVLDSRSNFLFAAPPAMDGGELYRRLKDRGVLVRHFDKPRISGFVRISVGTRAEMDTLIQAVRQL